MNTYHLNDTPLDSFGFVPGHAPGSNIALSGAWDMPARTGETSRQWAGEDGVEAYVDPADDFTFGRRELQLAGSLIADDQETLRQNIDRFRSFLASLPPASTLRCNWGEWTVGLRKEVKISPRKNIASVTLTFTEALPPVPDLGPQPPQGLSQWILAAGWWNPSGTWDSAAQWYCDPNSGNIDGWLWESLGLVVASTEGVWDLPASRELKVTVLPPTEPWAKGGLDKHTLAIKGTLRADSIEDLSHRSRSLWWLLGRPGLRSLRYKGRLYSLFATEGFQLTGIQKRRNIYAKITLKLTEAHE